ncbi:MAG: hypothetical protein OEW39_10510 [Deltaproteobacteria bacterium]|nr:hypothetical protein [Deltaproteobacteria bacterium]
MKTFKFHPDLTFRNTRTLLAELNAPAHKKFIAHLKWIEGEQAGQELVYLWDPYAERFGHQIDKDMIDHEVVESLSNEISVEVRLSEPNTRK